MARNGRKVETWKHHEYGVQIPIRLTTDGEFRADHADTCFKDSTLSGIRAQLKKAVDDSTRLVWRPIIELSCQSRQQTDRLHQFSETITTGIDLDVRRMWIAENPDGSFLMCSVWYSQTDSSPFPFPVEDGANHHGILDRIINSNNWYPPVKPLQLPFVKESKRYGGYRDQRNIFLSYSPELWDGLKVISARMEDIALLLETVLKSGDPLASLLPVTNRLALGV